MTDRQPICGTDFCALCGDCLYCFGEDPCQRSEDRRHYWDDGAVFGVEPAELLKRDDPAP